MTKEHPITPPPELVQQWLTEFIGDGAIIAPGELSLEIANRAAQWGAEKRMHQICGWLDSPSQNAADLICPLLEEFSCFLKKKALKALYRFEMNTHTNADEMMADFELLREAIEQLPS